MICNLCPRKCGVDRSINSGVCQQNDKIRIALTMLHHYEEPIISGTETDKGSGAIFFSGCNLRCVFCQNYKISAENKGEEISVEGLAEKFKELESLGALNINLVSPTHFCEQIIESLKIYKPKIPVVWNSNGYETEEMVEKLRDFVDIFLVDLKYAENDLAVKYSTAPNYFENAKRAIKKMRQIAPNDRIENGLMKAGIIVRHLVLPSHTNNSLKCLDFIANELGNKTIVSIMSQFEPMYRASEYPEINRHLTPLEYKRVVNHALKLGLTNAYTQELTSANKMYTPKF